MDDKILEAFSFGKIQECKNILLKLAEENIAWDEFLEWLDSKSAQLGKLPRGKIPPPPQQRLRRECPECRKAGYKRWLRLYEVNHHPCCMVGGSWKSQWRCAVCEWEEYSEKEIIDEAEPYLKDE